MVETAKKASPAAPEKAAVSKASRPTDAVMVKNISLKIINTSLDSIPSGKKGKCTNGELKRLNKFLEKA